MMPSNRKLPAPVPANLPHLRSRLRPFVGRADLTPMVDVLFLLLIFFMLSSNFVQVSGVEVDLPRTPATTTVGLEKFIVTVAMSSDGEPLIYFKDRLVGWDGLKEEFSQMRARSAQSTVIIRADKAVPHWVTTELMALAKQARLSSFVATLPPEEAPPTVFE